MRILGGEGEGSCVKGLYGKLTGNIATITCLLARKACHCDSHVKDQDATAEDDDGDDGGASRRRAEVSSSSTSPRYNTKKR